MASNYQLYIPAAGTNLLSNPSLEFGSTGYSGVASATVAESTEAAAFGGRSLKVTPASASAHSGAETTYAATANVTMTFSAYLLGEAGADYEVQADDGVTAEVDVVTATGDWQRVELTFTATISTAYDLRVVRVTAGTAVPFYLDGWQLEAGSEATTYVDGDQPGCAWNGAWHESTSSRSGQWRAGGRIVDLDTLGAYVTGITGLGMATYTNVATDNGIIGGATFQRSIVHARSFQLTVWFDAISQSDLHAQRQSLLDALAPNQVGPQQPIVLRYTGNGEPRIIHCHYEAGLESGIAWPLVEDVPVRFVAYDPYWYSEHTGFKLLKAFDEVTDADHILERAPNGTWHAMAGGLDGAVFAAVYGRDGNLYVGGAFITAYNAAGTGSPVTVNRIARWNGTTWEALGAGFNSTVRALTFTPDGTLYAGGDFTDAATPYIAAWNGSAWSAVGTAGDGTGSVFTLVYNSYDAKLYLGGDFTAWDGLADADYIVTWTGSAWAAVGGGTNDVVNAIVVEPTGDVVVGGLFTLAGALAVNRIVRRRTWTDTWESLNATFNDSVRTIAIDRAGRLYAGGAWTVPADAPYIAQYTGQSWRALGSGVDDEVITQRVAPDGHLVVGGTFTMAGGSTLRDRTAVWNGSAWETMMIDLPGAAIVRIVAHNVYTDEMTIGFTTDGTAIASNIVDVEVVNDGTEDSAPAIHIVCPTTATGDWTVEAIVNWTTGKALYFENLTVRPGEIVNMDLSLLTPQYLPTLFYPGYSWNGPRLWSSHRGDITRLIAPNSDLATWRLLPGSNTVLVKMKGTTDAGAAFLFNWKLRFLSQDG
jgi:hypothetical protein